MFTLALTSDAPWNETQWNNKAFDQAVAQARGTLDVEQRRALYAQAQQLVQRDVPYLIPFYQDLLAAKRSYVQDIVIHPRGNRIYIDRIWLGDGAPKRS